MCLKATKILYKYELESHIYTGTGSKQTILLTQMRSSLVGQCILAGVDILLFIIMQIWLIQDKLLRLVVNMQCLAVYGC